MSVTAKTEQTPRRPEGYPERVPEFATVEEERDFWDTHDSTYYMEGTEDVTHNPPPELKRGPGPGESRARKRPAEERAMTLLSLRLPDAMIAAVKEVAARRHLPYQTLMRSWIAERLEQEQETKRFHITPAPQGSGRSDVSLEHDRYLAEE